MFHQSVKLLVRGIFRLETCGALDMGDHRIEGAVPVVGGALATDRRVLIVDGPFAEDLDQARLADARFA